MLAARPAQARFRDGRPRHNRIVPKLIDVMPALATANPEATIYVATPAEPQSDVMIRVEPVDGGNPDPASTFMIISTFH